MSHRSHACYMPHSYPYPPLIWWSSFSSALQPFKFSPGILTLSFFEDDLSLIPNPHPGGPGFDFRVYFTWEVDRLLRSPPYLLVVGHSLSGPLCWKLSDLGELTSSYANPCIGPSFSGAVVFPAHFNVNRWFIYPGNVWLTVQIVKLSRWPESFSSASSHFLS